MSVRCSRSVASTEQPAAGAGSVARDEVARHEAPRARGRLMRRTAILVGALLALLLFAGCRDTDRVILDKGDISSQAEPGQVVYRVSWRSDKYGLFGTARTLPPDDPWVRDCYLAATIGETAPHACVTRAVLLIETGSLTNAPWRSFSLILLAIAAVGYVGMRHVARAPPPAAVVAEPVRVGGPGPDLSVFTRADVEKVAFAPVQQAHSMFARSGYGMRMGLRGAAAAAAVAVALGLLVGFETGGEWAMLTSLSLLLFTTVAYVVGIATTNNVRETLQIRAIFTIGSGLGFLGGAFIGSLLLDPLIGWDGVRWFI